MAGSDLGSNDKSEPRVRNLRKRLAQIATIEQKQDSGLDLTDDQIDKLSRKAHLETELQEILEPATVVSNVEALKESSVEGPFVVQVEQVQREEPSVDLAEMEGHEKVVVTETLAEMETVERPSQQSHEEMPEPLPDTLFQKRSKAVEMLRTSSKVEPEPESKSDSRLRNLRKKLAQIAALEEKQDVGNVELTPDQLEKMSHKTEFEAELVKAEAISKSLTISNLNKKYFVACPWCKLTVLPYACPWSSWDCSVCRGDFLQTVMIYSCPNQAECQSINEWGICEKCASKRSKGKELGLLDIDENSTRILRSPSSVLRSPSSVHSPSISLCRSPSMRWQDDPVAVEDISPSKPSKAPPTFEFLENIQPFSLTVKSSERPKALTKEVSLLSQDAFEEDALTYVTRKGGWKMTIMALPEGAKDCSELPFDGFCLDGPGPSLIGFIIYRLRPELDSLSIAKLAIVPEHRQRGHGRRLIEWCIKLGKKQPEITFISLSSLPEAVKFYLALGFKAIDVKLENCVSAQCGPDEDLVEGQVYMEYRIKGRSRARKKGK